MQYLRRNSRARTMLGRDAGPVLPSSSAAAS
jgi:hypothetical protein